MIIFIAGAHAVGKSYLCEKFIEKHKFTHKSASQLIAEGKKMSWGKDKLTGSPLDNQIVLINQLEKIRDKNENLLLDGHFVLIDSAGDYIELPEEVFDKMQLDRVILIEAEDDIIPKRFAERGAKLTYQPNILRQKELEHATNVCNSLGIRIIKLSTPTHEEFEKAVNEI